MDITEKMKYFIHRILVFFRYSYFKLVGRSTLDVRAIVVDSSQKVLLVKHTYIAGWYLPGGLVERGESLTTAVIRELYEETGIKPTSKPLLFSVYLHSMKGVSNYPAVFIIDQYKLLPQKSPEIKELGWFSTKELPADTSPATQRRLKEYFEQLPIAEKW